MATGREQSPPLSLLSPTYLYDKRESENEIRLPHRTLPN